MHTNTKFSLDHWPFLGATLIRPLAARWYKTRKGKKEKGCTFLKPKSSGEASPLSITQYTFRMIVDCKEIENLKLPTMLGL